MTEGRCILISWLHYLPPKYLPPLRALPQDLFCRITEVRFRLDKPFSVTADGRNILPDENGIPLDTAHALTVTREDLDSLVARLTEGSLYAFEDCMAQGFLPLPDGCRAGIAGDMVETKTGLHFREITSVNLRISRFLPQFARPLTDMLKHTAPKGVLVISPPAGGKTTFLRSAAWQLCNGAHPYRVGLADERSELYLPSGLCDRVTGCAKWKAVELLTRTMSPEYLVCDELGVGEETALLAAQNTGVRLIASVHGGSVGEALKRPCAKTLFDAGVFDLFVLLTKPYRVEILQASEVVACV